MRTQIARAWLLNALVVSACLPTPAPYRCDLAGGDRACDSVPEGRCVRGYCAALVSNALCASGLRYTATALEPGACVAVDASVDDVLHDVPSGDRDAVSSDHDVTADAAEAALPEDHLVSIDAVPSDLVEASAPFDATGATDAESQADAIDAAAPEDHGLGVDRPDALVTPDVFDVPAPRDAVDVADVVDAAGASAPPVQWISPLPNERSLSGRIRVRISRRGMDRVTVRTALGAACAGAQTVTVIPGTQVDVTTGRNYLCLRLEVGDDGGVWTSPWRRVVSMGRVYDAGATAHWGHWPDFNNDGRADLLVATASAVRVFHFTQNGSIVSGPLVPGPSLSARAAALAAVGDVDGDSFGDAVIAWNMNPGREVYLHRGSPSGLLGAGTRIAGSGGGVNTDLSLGDRVFSIGDRGADGRANFGLSAQRGHWVRTFGLDALGRLEEGPSYVSGAPIEAFVSDADLDADALPDAAFTTGGGTFLSLSSQVNNITIPPDSGNGSGFGRVLAIGSDLDNDGRGELAVISPNASQAVVYSWVNNALRTLTRVDLARVQPAALLMAGDVNDDLVDDLFAFTGGDLVRLQRGGFTNAIDGALAWRDPLGVILAGTADTDTRGRVWGGGTPGLAPNGFIVYGYSGSALTSFPVADTGVGAVTALAP